MSTTLPETNLGEEIRQATADMLGELLTKVTRRAYSPRIKLLNLEQVLEATNLGKTTLYEMIDRGEFPKPFKVSGKNLWRESTLIAWCDANDPNKKKAG